MDDSGDESDCMLYNSELIAKTFIHNGLERNTKDPRLLGTRRIPLKAIIDIIYEYELSYYANSLA